jgi:iturin family lipopeptide synthetase A
MHSNTVSLFEAKAASCPASSAILHENHFITYQELNQRANQLAHYLQHAGVKPEILVGIALPRSFDMIVSVLAVLKAGGAYLPLDPCYPPASVFC